MDPKNPTPYEVTSVVCWPASVSATLEEVRKGNVPRPLGAMGDWVTGRETSVNPPSSK